MKLTINTDAMRADTIGPEHGLTREDLDAIQPKAQAAFDAVARLRAGTDVAFFRLPYDTETVKRIKRAARAITERCDNFVVLGIGGSALGTTAVHSALRHPFWNLLGRQERAGRPRLFVLDNVDPDWLAAFGETVNLKRTVFNVVTKSGSTSETMAQFVHFRAALLKALGPKHTRNLVVTTDPTQGLLRKMLNTMPEEERHEAFEVPPGVGGRFSVLSAVGLLPLAVVGVNVDKLIAGARDADAACKERDWRKNPALLSAALLYLAHTRKGKGLTVMMPYSQRLRDVADWFRQLWAESLGKRVNRAGDVVHVGLTPIKALGVTDQHSQVQLYAEGPFDKVIVFVRVEQFDKKLSIPSKNLPVEGLEYLGGHTFNELIDVEQRATQAALTKAGRPSMTISLPKVTAETVGELLHLLQMQTAYAGALYGIDAFDQPGVEEGKQFTYGLMGRTGFEQKAEEYRRIAERGGAGE
ncbi:MAG: glucose-6-phosphate isomerase [Verrucomicrobia bacterium]|nr:glucose-6-phosphate isomerase [Verrucomicrobiota bacterium]